MNTRLDLVDAMVSLGVNAILRGASVGEVQDVLYTCTCIFAELTEAQLAQLGDASRAVMRELTPLLRQYVPSAESATSFAPLMTLMHNDPPRMPVAETEAPS